MPRWIESRKTDGSWKRKRAPTPGGVGEDRGENQGQPDRQAPLTE